VGSIPDHACNFSTTDRKKMNEAPSARIIEVCGDNKRLLERG